MMKKIYLYVVVLFLLTACSVSPGKSKEGNMVLETEEHEKVFAGLPVLDLQKQYPKKTVVLQDIADVEYVVLETNKDALLDIIPTIITSDRIIARNHLGTIVIFDRTGKHLRSFNHKGQSGEEYGNPINLAADDKEIFVMDFWKKIIQVYDYEGTYRRTLRLPPKSWLSLSTFNYDNDFLLGDDQYMVDAGKDEQINKTPYCKISKKTGELTPLPLEFTKRIRDGLSYQIDEHGSMGAVLGVSPIATFGSDGLIADLTLDTAYIYRNDTLIPIAVRTNRVSENGNPIIATIDVLTDRYQLWVAIEKAIDWESKTVPDPVCYLFDKKNGECYEVDIYNKDGVSCSEFKHMAMRLSANIHSMPKNTAMQICHVSRLLELNSKGKLQGELKEIASKLDEDDNPVLMIVKFRE